MLRFFRFLFKSVSLIIVTILTIALISHLIGINIYLRELRNVRKLATIEEQLDYEVERTNEIYAYASLYQMVFAGGGWRVRAVNMLNKKIFEYFPEEANSNVNALTHLADSYMWLESKGSRLQAISLYRRAIAVFKEKHLNETPAQGVDQKHFELDKYKFLIQKHDIIAKNYMEMKDYDDVIKEYQIVIDGYSDNMKDFDVFDQYLLVGKAYENIGEIQFRCLNNFDEAINYFTAVQGLFPIPLVIVRNQNNVGDCYLAMGNEQKAKEIYQNIINEFDNRDEITDIKSTRFRLNNLKGWKETLTRVKPIL